MKQQYIKLELKANGGDIEFIASDETKDRHGDVISLESWDLANFLSAPRMLIDHWHSVENIVGKWTNVRVDKSTENPGLKMKAVFHNITRLSREVSEMVKKGFLNTVSVGFIPHMDTKTGADGEEMQIPRNELIEVSLVTVPANPNAQQIKSLMEAGQMGLEEKKDLEEFLTVDNLDEKEEKTEVEDNNEEVSIAENEELADEVKEEEIKPTEKGKDTPEDIGKSKGRRLSPSEKKLLIARSALKESAKQINFALNRINLK